KTRDEMKAALRAGILTFNVESAEELAALEGVARGLKKKAPVALRINPDVDAKTHPHITTGRYDNKFGVEPREALALYEKASRSPFLRPRGVQCHIGSQITSAAPYRAAARAVAGAIKRLAAKGIRLEQADFGGGLGVAAEGAPELDLS